MADFRPPSCYGAAPAHPGRGRGSNARGGARGGGRGGRARGFTSHQPFAPLPTSAFAPPAQYATAHATPPEPLGAYSAPALVVGDGVGRGGGVRTRGGFLGAAPRGGARGRGTSAPVGQARPFAPRGARVHADPAPHAAHGAMDEGAWSDDDANAPAAAQSTPLPSAADAEERISRADLGLSARVCGRFAPAELFERKGALALRVAAQRRALSDADVPDLALELRRECERMHAEHAARLAAHGSALRPGARVLVDVCAEENFGRLTDAGVATLCAALCALEPIAQPRILRLHANAIGDAGAAALGSLLRRTRWPIEELHLSHNRITTAGLLSIVRAALAPVPQRAGAPQLLPSGGGDGGGGSGALQYPRLPNRTCRAEAEGARVPLWLRVEFNTIDVDEASRALDADERARLCVVSAATRGAGPTRCSVHACRRCARGAAPHGSPPLPAVHLPYFELQKLRGGQRLCAAGARRPRAPSAAARAADAGARADEPEAAAAPAAGAADGAEPAPALEPPALWLLLDTNAVVSMAGGAARGASLTFERVAAGAALCADVRLFLIETVRQQLEGIKDAPGTRADASAAVRRFFGAQLVELTECGWLAYLDTAEVEDLARSLPSHVEIASGRVLPGARAAGGGSVRRDMDGRIIDCARVLSSQLGAGQRLLLLSDDAELVSRAHRHAVPAETWRALDRAAAARAAAAAAGAAGSSASSAARPAPLSAADVIGACAPPCRRLLEQAGEASAVLRGPFEELGLATQLGAQAAAALRDAAARAEAGAALAVEGATSALLQWRQLAEALEVSSARWDGLARSHGTLSRQSGAAQRSTVVASSAASSCS